MSNGNFGDEIYFDLPPFLGSKFFEKNNSNMTKWGLKFYFEDVQRIAKSTKQILLLVRINTIVLIVFFVKKCSVQINTQNSIFFTINRN